MPAISYWAQFSTIQWGRSLKNCEYKEECLPQPYQDEKSISFCFQLLVKIMTRYNNTSSSDVTQRLGLSWSGQSETLCASYFHIYNTTNARIMISNIYIKFDANDSISDSYITVDVCHALFQWLFCTLLEYSYNKHVTENFISIWKGENQVK